MLDLCAAFLVAWFFAKYYPRWADHRARRSRIAAEKRADELVAELQEYEKAITSPGVFLAGLLVKGVTAFRALVYRLDLGF
jgi:hypothetical protein